MKKLAVSLLSVVTLLIVAAPSQAFAWHRGWFTGPRVVIGAGPVWWGPPYWYYPPPYVYAPPPVVVQQPPVYVQQPPLPPSPPPAPAPPAAAQAYWHYCASAKAYYPNVETCPEGWIKVPARSE